MEILEAVGWIVFGFAPTFIALTVVAKAAKKHVESQASVGGPMQPAFLMQGSGLDQADFEGFGPLPRL